MPFPPRGFPWPGLLPIACSEVPSGPPEATLANVSPKNRGPARFADGPLKPRAPRQSSLHDLPAGRAACQHAGPNGSRRRYRPPCRARCRECTPRRQQQAQTGGRGRSHDGLCFTGRAVRLAFASVCLQIQKGPGKISKPVGRAQRESPSTHCQSAGSGGGRRTITGDDGRVGVAREKRTGAIAAPVLFFPGK